jgi:hypothetical protein
VNPRLPLETLVRLEHVTARGPGMSGAARNFSIPQMRSRGAAVLCCELELRRRLVVELRGRFERLAQFQTLTSR